MTVEPAIRQIAISSGLRTSRMSGAGLMSSRAWSSVGVISSWAAPLAPADGSGTLTPQNC